MRVRLFPLVRVFLGLLVATGCGSSNQPLSSGNWNIKYSPNMPSDPTMGGPGIWYFDFPVDPNYPACIANQNCNSVGYVTDSHSGPVSHSASMTFQIVTTGVPFFNYVMESDNTCTTPATVRLFLERKNDDLAEEFYRWWAIPVG